MLVSWVSCLFLVLCQSLDLCLHSIHPHNRRLLSGMTPGRHTLFWLSITFCCQWPGNSRYIREKSKLFVFHDRYSMSQLTEIVACGKYNWDTYAIVNIHNTCFSIIYLYVFICFFKKWPILHPFYHSWCIPRDTSPGSSQPICMSKAKERGSITASSDRKNKPNLRGTVIARAPGEKELAHQLQHPNPQLCSYLFLRVIWDIFRLQLVKGGRGDGQAGRRSFGSGFAACSVTRLCQLMLFFLFGATCVLKWFQVVGPSLSRHLIRGCYIVFFLLVFVSTRAHHLSFPFETRCTSQATRKLPPGWNVAPVSLRCGNNFVGDFVAAAMDNFADL